MDCGKLQEELSLEWKDDVILTEKIDGTNARIIFVGDDFFIGSRENLLYAKGDRIGDPSMGIVQHLKPIAKTIEALQSPMACHPMTFYGEFYGGKVSAASKQYTTTGMLSFRIFDVASIDPDTFNSLIDKPREEIARWRQTTGPRWLNETCLKEVSDTFSIPLTPRLAAPGQPALPRGLKETQDWLRSVIEKTHVALDEDAQGKPEGLVIRNSDRSCIAKLRFEDYRKALKHYDRRELSQFQLLKRYCN